ncbi:MAG: hypothetical protein A2934_04115 [Candidatus Sungbacteria bacterium RIFCSPLOWO2_01_FULL_47_10]|uniref:DUF420 domain-containing protein n=1 Tax=Candidatus Sungbacteria bacterium RIFCSPLOWO2_01_FULL_47_10 TaxID=1802276 RepID=A0A1G2L0C1_9BACT|nr:MAG: hypothetical protein A2934_04115 [Candidatus Sungbacteria bacterium RIFCSPLOWO2_01_FULL_47_10]
MTTIPLYSIVTLVTELFVTVGVFYVVISAYRTGVFRTKLAIVLVTYEILFNISYMAYRALSSSTAEAAKQVSSFHTGLAIFHGLFSLVMFVALLIFMFLSWRRYRLGMNFFKNHAVLTITFLSSWMIAVLSGILFFIVMYLA